MKPTASRKLIAPISSTKPVSQKRPHDTIDLGIKTSVQKSVSKRSNMKPEISLWSEKYSPETQVIISIESVPVLWC